LHSGYGRKRSAPGENSLPGIQIPPEDAAKANPVKPTSESLAKGKKMYGIDCAMCHGNSGDGKGDIGGDFKSIPDFTNPDALKIVPTVSSSTSRGMARAPTCRRGQPCQE